MNTNKTPTPEKQAEHVAGLLRALYRTNDGPRLIAELMREFPNPRRVWNDADGRKHARWGMRATGRAGAC